MIAVCFILITSGCVGQDVSIASWPFGHKSAAVITFDVERAQPEDIQKVADILDEREVNATFFVVAGYYDGIQGTLSPLKNFEVASKGWNQGEWAERYEDQRDSVDRAHQMLSSQGFTPAGFRSPFLKNNEETFRVLSELGYAYDSSETGLLPSIHDGVVEIPLSVAYDPFWNEDVEYYVPLLYLAFENTYENGGLFTFYTLPEHVDEGWVVFLNHISEKDLWLASGREVAEWWKKRDSLSLSVEGGRAIIENKGADPISGVTVEKGDERIIIPDLKPGEKAEVRF